MYFTIYKTTNLINGRFYIGKHQTKNINDKYLGSGKYLLKAIKKYGRENFKKEILCLCETEDEMNIKEQELVIIDRAISYNLCSGGKGGFSYINNSGIDKFKGKKHSDEAKRKVSLASSGRTHSEETKEKIKQKSIENNTIRFVDGKRGFKSHSNETKMKIRNSILGRKRSDESRIKQSLTKQRNGYRPSDETKRKISESLKKTKNADVG